MDRTDCAVCACSLRLSPTGFFRSLSAVLLASTCLGLFVGGLSGCGKPAAEPPAASAASGLHADSTPPTLAAPDAKQRVSEIRACAAATTIANQESADEQQPHAMPTAISPVAEDPTAVTGPVFSLAQEDLAHQQNSGNAPDDTATHAAPVEASAVPNELSHSGEDLEASSLEPAPLGNHQDNSEPLPWGPSMPSPELAAVSQRAEQSVRNGFNLAERGALYSARSQFIEALRTLADAQDTQHNSTGHTRALGAGLRALEEVNDFVPRGEQVDVTLNLRLIVDAHHTSVLKERSLEGITPKDAQRIYLTYVQEQLAAAGGDQPVASLALYGLGKICAAPAEMHGPPEQIAEAKAVVLYQSALLIEPRNFMAANELGVLLAGFGRLNESQSILQQATATGAMPAAWRNLAAVDDRLGETQQAERARQQAVTSVARLQQAGYAKAGSKYPIEWIDPAAFAQTNSMMVGNPSGAAPQTASVMKGTSTATQAAASADATTPPVTTAAKPSAKNGFWSWLK